MPLSSTRWKLAIALLASCAHRPAPAPELLAEADRAVERFIAQRQLPGAALWIERLGHGSHHRTQDGRCGRPRRSVHEDC